MGRLGTMTRFAVVCAILTTAVAARTPSTDYSGCHDDLDRLRKGASEASDAAEHAKTARDDLDECREYPDTYDLMRDGCRSLRSDYESSITDLEGKMDDLDDRLRS